jgi:hypothetical protein
MMIRMTIQRPLLPLQLLQNMAFPFSA